ncbi:hypothetical protein AAVH_41142, partial [Aphelenchoides avenae]
MEWKGALGNAESRLNVLKFNQREELEALQLTSKQWRRTVDRYSPELALRRIGYVKMDRMWGATFYFGETSYPGHTAYASDAAFSTEGFDDEEINCDSAVFDARVANGAKVAMTTPKCTRLNHCFIEWLCLRADEGSPTGIVATDFGANFCAWIKALQQLQADVRVRTLEVFEPYYKIGMDTVYRHLGSTFSVYEYFISKTNIGTRDIGRFDELCVDVLKEEKRVSIHLYNLDDDDDDDEAEDEQHENNFDVDDKPKINGSVNNIIDFVFSSPRCEELYLAVEVGGKGLFDKLIR